VSITHNVYQTITFIMHQTALLPLLAAITPHWLHQHLTLSVDKEHNLPKIFGKQVYKNLCPEFLLHLQKQQKSSVMM
jgi:hypothetical protein